MAYQRLQNRVWLLSLSLFVLGAGSVAPAQDLLPVKVALSTRAISKTPVLIAYDRGIYKKYGLEVQLWMPRGEFPGAIEMGGEQMENPDISVDSGVAMIVPAILHRGTKRLALASTNCGDIFNIIGQKETKSLQELRGKRLGISDDGSMGGFVSRLLAQRMGWERGKDIFIVEQAGRLRDLREGKVDAIAVNAENLNPAEAQQAGYPVLANTAEDWRQSIAGNGIGVEWNWIKDPRNRDLAMRFLKGTVEGLAILFHNRNEALRVLDKYHGIKDTRVAASMYEVGLRMSRKPFPCVDGITKLVELYDLATPRQYQPADFYDDSLMTELDKSGFIDGIYQQAR